MLCSRTSFRSGIITSDLKITRSCRVKLTVRIIKSCDIIPIHCILPHSSYFCLLTKFILLLPDVDDLGTPHLARGDLGDDLVQSLYKWKSYAGKNDEALPFFSKWEVGKDLTFKAAIIEKDMSSETSFAVVDDGECVDGKNIGTYGILKSYSQ